MTESRPTPPDQNSDTSADPQPVRAPLPVWLKVTIALLVLLVGLPLLLMAACYGLYVGGH